MAVFRLPKLPKVFILLANLDLPIPTLRGELHCFFQECDYFLWYEVPIHSPSSAVGEVLKKTKFFLERILSKFLSFASKKATK